MTANESHFSSAILSASIIGFDSIAMENEEMAFRMFQKFEECIKEVVKRFKGQIDVFNENECILLFDDPNNAISSAMEIQSNLNESKGFSIGIGLHYGELTRKEGRVVGDALKICNDIESLGEANSVLLSHEIQDQIKSNLEFDTLELGLCPMKSVDQDILIYALITQGLRIPNIEDIRGPGQLVRQPLFASKRQKYIVFLGLSITIILVVIMLLSQ